MAIYKQDQSSLQNRQISGANTIHERAREARSNTSRLAFVLAFRARAPVSRSAPLIRLFCRLYQRVELWSTEKQLQLSDIRTGLEPRTYGFQVWRPNHSATLAQPHQVSLQDSCVEFFGKTLYAFPGLVHPMMSSMI